MKIYRKGMVIKVQVTGFEKYGIFVNVDDIYTGMIHISEISDGFVKNVTDYVSVGETIFATIIEINEITKQLKLSIKDNDYKLKGNFPKVVETKNGFDTLKLKLQEWINKKKE